LITAVSITLCAAPGSRADDLEVLRRIAAEGQQRTQDELLACPDFRPGQTVQIHELVRVSIENGLIVPRSSLPVPGGQSVCKVRIEGLEGWTRLTVRAPRQPAGDDPSTPPTNEWYVGLLRSKHQNPQDREDLVLDAHAGGITLSKNHNSTQRTLNVVFKQVMGAPEQGLEPQVTLSVYDRDDQRGNPVSITINEPDFGILRRHHSAEINQYLRPLLREFRIKGLFNIDHVVASQVFPKQWKRDEAMLQKVAALVQGLDADDYSARQEAMSALRNLGPDAALYLFHQDQSRLSTEQLSRSDVLMAAHRLLGHEQAARLGEDPEFLLDCVEGDDPAVRQAAVERLEKLTGKRPEIDANDSHEVRSKKVEKMRMELMSKPRNTNPAIRRDRNPGAMP